jgi:endonuclease G
VYADAVRVAEGFMPSQRIRQLVEQSRAARHEVRQLHLKGRGLDAEPNPIRAADYVSRQITVNGPGPEALVGETNDLQAIWFLVRGAAVRRAVAFVEVSVPGSSDRGSGFLISPHLFLTNQHVIPNAAAAKATQITFDNERDENGLPVPTTIFRLDPDRFALFSDQNDLDYALIAVGPRVLGNSQLDDFGYCILSDRPDRHAIGMNVNIIQHPSGLPKMVALRHNLLTYRTDHTLLYETDTEHGSSGSPVFNDFWEVVALHHFGAPFLERADENGTPIPTSVNEGVRISAIYTDLAARMPALPAAQSALLGEALAYDKQPAMPAGGHILKPRQPTSEGSESIIVTQSGIPMADNSQEVRVSVPLEITIRLGAAAQSTASVAAGTAAVARAKKLAPMAEALHIDQNYGSRSGYNSQFIPGIEIALPMPDAKLAKQIAPLNADQPAADNGELKYEHFSLKLNKSKRIAIFTATNIDGKTYLAVDRNTGTVSDDAEGDKWFIDPRIDGAFYLNQSFYGGWSDYFDRGHLTRRTDPTWGTPEESERANADTFHFTNCSPQHFRFNESAKYWQGAERYVLENGVLSTDSKGRIAVFQGPIFNNQIDLMADDVQIPSSFFKVIVWKGQGGLKSVGLIVDQLPLLSETRKKMGAPQSLPSVNVSQWRVSISSIEKKTGLSFGPAVKGADTIGATQPTVGEALIAITSYTDLLPQAL